jgi:hypothetical protein
VLALLESVTRPGGTGGRVSAGQGGFGIGKRGQPQGSPPATSAGGYSLSTAVKRNRKLGSITDWPSASRVER